MSLRSVGLMALAVLAGVVWLSRRPPARAVRPNILLVSVDSLRADHVHSYGYGRETSPTIDALAREGALFRRAVAPATWTLPSHMTLLTAKPPELHGVTSNERRLDARALTLAEVLRDAGYTTAGIVAAPYVRAMYGFDQGFDLYDESIVKDDMFEFMSGATSPESLRLVSSYLEGWNRDGRKKPFFVFLHLWDVHYDYDPPPPYDTLFDPDYDGPYDGTRIVLDPSINATMNPRDIEHLKALYDGEIRYTDEHLGKLMEVLRRLGVLDDTIVVLTADHGEEFFEHGRKAHGEALYDETVLVPLVIRYPPRVDRGLVIERQARLMDVAPTLLELADVAAPDDFGTPRGTPNGALSLASALDPAGAAPVPDLVAFSTTKMGHYTRSSVRKQDEKLIVQSPGPPRPEIYDLASDPAERNNLARGNPSPRRARWLESELQSWAAMWSKATQLASALDVPSDQAERLRALGYVQ